MNVFQYALTLIILCFTMTMTWAQDQAPTSGVLSIVHPEPVQGQVVKFSTKGLPSLEKENEGQYHTNRDNEIVIQGLPIFSYTTGIPANLIPKRKI